VVDTWKQSISDNFLTTNHTENLGKFQTESMSSRRLPDSERFPLLIKILDARSDLSIQVHPPEAKALTLNGEPKTEMWYIAHADQNAKLYVGLKHGVT